MSDSRDTWPQPKYNPGPAKHLHAIGVIANNYCDFEDRLFDIFIHHLDNHKVPKATYEPFYFEMSERKRLDFIQVIFSIYEKDPQVMACVAALIKYFEWCVETRNYLMHAKPYSAMFGGDPDKIYLSKRANKRTSRLAYLVLDLPTLRNAADNIQAGLRCCTDLHLFLRLRDTPREHWSVALKALAPQPLPNIPAPPESLSLLQYPHTQSAPAHLRRSSEE
jgi:hypothetical protein